jgi:ATP-dependent Clp protease ATP-binding subunit ClpA
VVSIGGIRRHEGYERRFEDSAPKFSAELESTLYWALAYANERKHEYTTLEHLLLALIDDANASAMMKACDVDPGQLTENLNARSPLRRPDAVGTCPPDS